MRTSVILSTYNQPVWLRHALTGYACQQVKPAEIVIADDGSKDETRQLIGAFRRRGELNLKHVWHEDRGFRKTRILNLAIDAAEGDYLIFSDGDCVPRSDYVAQHQRLARPGCFLSGGLMRLPLHTSRQLTPELIELGRCFTPGWIWRQGGVRPFKLLKLAVGGVAAAACNRLAHVLPHWSGSNASCWKRDAVAVGGFDERMTYWREDFEFGQRLMHLGITPKQVRYSAITLHLEHGRSYVSVDMKAKNEMILAETRASGKVVTEFGLRPAA